MVQYRIAKLYIIITVPLFLLFIPFRGGKHSCLNAKSTYKIGKSTLIISFIKGDMPTLKIKHLSIHFFLHRPRLFHFSTEKIRAQSVRNGHQSGFSRADTINNNINKTSKKFSVGGNY